MSLDRFPNILEIFPNEWFDDGKNKDHPLFILNSKSRYDFSEYFEIFNENLYILNENNLINKDLRDKLNNSPQFEDTLIEIKTACYLIKNKIDIRLSKSFPDVEIPELNSIIEVKNLHTSQKLLEPMGEYAEEIDDITRIWDIILDKILSKLLDDKINFILMNVPPGVDFGEFMDLLIFCQRNGKGGVIYNINTETKQVIRHFLGEFSKKENDKISSVIMMKNNHFKGVINPLNNKKIPDILKKLFNLIEIHFTK